MAFIVALLLKFFYIKPYKPVCEHFTIESFISAPITPKSLPKPSYTGMEIYKN